ncbi:MAG: hypothetical protein Q8N99_06690 [Nanoarchaeota archaeon]|nr:hypothetical protein [Nanoarchaeota archaeon]
MEFDKREPVKKTGIFSGFMIMYLVFTTILYFVLNYVRESKISFFYVLSITLFIVLVGNLIKFWFRK